MDEHINIRAVIFDMDGVLVDSEPLINAAAIAMFREKGLMVQPADVVRDKIDQVLLSDLAPL